MYRLSIPLEEIEKDPKGKDSSDAIQTRGNNGPSLFAQPELLLVCSGKLKTGGNGTLLIFCFMFTGLEDDSSQRLTSAEIRVEFSDEQSRIAYDPQVVSVWPARQQRFDIVTENPDIRREGNMALRTEGLPFQFEAGRQWMVSATSMASYCTKLSATRFNTRLSMDGTWNSVIWKLNEHSLKKQGVPHLLQTAVIVRRRGDGRFVMKIKIETTTNLQAGTINMMEKLVGTGQSELVDPVNIDSKLFMIKEIDIPELADMRSKGEIMLDDLKLENYVGLMHKENKEGIR
ncbi:hypothetical protein T069G_05069 [Trichoderma breve]|uniref:Uncharacterized protein n=1 Tax=Trichoderma breve TaxID=2034170 RepID=A0A9W9BID0_9HYPO|nr:hypothetical protein T069G_05069 [Trichoderma breve]KAJ4860081.1 hypothetical protein T069G_05069 [Trichoderma breve]